MFLLHFLLKKVCTSFFCDMRILVLLLVGIFEDVVRESMCFGFVKITWWG